MAKTGSLEEFGAVDRARAEEVARIFLRHHDIHKVEIFGSVAREGYGNDLDIILITDEVLQDQFVDRMQYELMRFNTDAYNTPELRRTVASAVMGEYFNDILASATRIITPAELDIFIFGPDWRDFLAYLQFTLGNKDPRFMENIARDARVIAP